MRARRSVCAALGRRMAPGGLGPALFRANARGAGGQPRQRYRCLPPGRGAGRAALAAARRPGAAWDLMRSEGGWSQVLSVPRSRSEEEWALALLEAGVLVHPGYFFDFPAGAHLVVSLLPEPVQFARAAAILARVLCA